MWPKYFATTWTLAPLLTRRDSHELIVEESNPLIKDYSYSEVESNGIKVFVRSICKKDNTNAFLEVLKKYYDYSLEFVDTNEW